MTADEAAHLPATPLHVAAQAGIPADDVPRSGVIGALFGQRQSASSSSDVETACRTADGTTSVSSRAVQRASQPSPFNVSASPTPSVSRAVALWTIIRFGLWVFVLAGAMSLAVKPWVHLSLWMIFRRCVSIAAAISLWVSMARWEWKPVRACGLSSSRDGAEQLACGLLLGASILVFMLAMYLMTGVCHFNMAPDRVKLWHTLVGFAPAALLVGVLEELVFRGYLLRHLLPYSKPVACIASSLLYAVVHLKTPPTEWMIWMELSGLFLLGVILSLSYLLTKQLYFAVGLHAVLAYGARVNKLVISFPNSSLPWLFGTSRLVNGLVSWVGLLLVWGILVWWWRSSLQTISTLEDADCR